MADPISAEERRTCWQIMSVLFANRDVDYNQLAQRLTQQCPNMTIVSLKQSLFDEVMPAVSAAAMIPAFPLWIDLTPNEVSELVGDMLARRSSSLRCMLGNSFWRLSSRSLARNKWHGLEKELRRFKPHLSSPEGNSHPCARRGPDATRNIRRSACDVMSVSGIGDNS